MAINDDLQDDAVRHAIFLERLKNREVRRILSKLNNDVLPDVIAEIERRMRTNISTKRFVEMRQAYSLLLREGYKRLGIDLKSDLLDIGMNEAQNQIGLINKNSPIALSLQLPSTSIMQQIVNGKVRGQTIKKYFSNLATKDANEISRQLQIGLSEGEAIPEMVRRIRGTRAQAFSDGVLNTTRHNAQTIVRTSVNHVTTQAREAMYEANTDVIKAVKYIATLDARTTPICADLDGEVFPIGEGPRPPQHFNCRSTTVPVVKSFDELGIPGLKKLPPATRASASATFKGQVPADQTYPQWLRKQSKSVQQMALGNERSAMFRRGKLNDKFFFNDKSKQLTLPQMRKAEAKLE